MMGGLLLLFLGNIGLVVVASQAAGKSERVARTLVRDLESLLSLYPAPSEANLNLARADLEAFRNALETSLAIFDSANQLSVSSDAIEVLPKIQGLIVDFRREAGRVGIAIPPEAAFGFDRYEESVEPPPAESISLLDKQIQILDYLIGILMTTSPEAIVDIEREYVEAGDPNTRDNGVPVPEVDGTFAIDEAVTARIPETVHTLAFRLTFSGYTESLRRLLNTLGKFEYPLVVRSVGVRPTTEDRRQRAGSINATGGSPFASLFGSSDEAVRPDEGGEEGVLAQLPIIEDNLSEYSVTVEYIEVVLNLDEIEAQFEEEFRE